MKKHVPTASQFDLIELKWALEAILHRKVDVLTYRSINPKLRERILSEQVLIQI